MSRSPFGGNDTTFGFGAVLLSGLARFCFLVWLNFAFGFGLASQSGLIAAPNAYDKALA
jgi:hypothetical protein